MSKPWCQWAARSGIIAETIYFVIKTFGARFVKFLTICCATALFGSVCVNGSTLLFTATTDTGELAEFTLDSSVPNTYDPALYPNSPVRGVYLGSVHGLSFETTDIGVSDLAATPGETGVNQKITIIDVGPLFNLDSLSLELIFDDPSLVSPLSANASAYERSFDPTRSVLFPQTPPARTHVDLLTSLTVSEIPEPHYGAVLALLAVAFIALRRRSTRSTPDQSENITPFSAHD